MFLFSVPNIFGTPALPTFVLIAPLTAEKPRNQERKDREREPENTLRLKLMLKVLVSSRGQVPASMLVVEDEAPEWAGDPEENFMLVHILSLSAPLLPRSSASFKL
jgi:hypothetical protein